jgi:3-oxoadipate CoA-transferase beta subunit
MEHQARNGASKIVAHCSYPLTGIGCVNRIYTDLAVLDVGEHGLIVREIVAGMSFAQLQACTDAPLLMPPEANPV